MCTDGRVQYEVTLSLHPQKNMLYMAICMFKINGMIIATWVYTI